MKFSSKVILITLLPLFFGCNSSDSEKVTVIKEVSSTEGSLFSFELPEGTNLLDENNSEIYFKLVDGQVTGTTPSVDENKSFLFKLNDYQAVELKVTNKDYVPLEEKTRTYAFSSSNIGKYGQFLTSGNDIPLFKIGDEEVHYPVTVSKYAHDLYASYLINDSAETLELFYINANWLRDNCIYTPYGFCSWRTAPAYTPYKTGPDWPSAMAQGQAISVMISAYSITKDSSYLKVAQDAIAAFNYPGELKGVNSQWDEYYWYEEYTSEEPARVLNGFLFAIAGLYDALELLDDETAEIAFEQGVLALKNKLHLYDADFTSLYDNEQAVKRYASAKGRSLDGYHELHIFQFAWLYQVTQDTQFLDIFKKFLANDIGLFRSRQIKSGDSNRIEAINVTHSVNSTTNGPIHLTDRNWTYGNYWSTHRNGTEVIFDLNEINDSEGVKCLMMSSIDTKYFPKYFDIYSYQNDQWDLAMTREEVGEIAYTDHTWAYQSHTSTARTYCFESPIKTTDKLKIAVYLSDSNLVAIREMDVHYNRSKIELELLSIYDKWAPKK